MQENEIFDTMIQLSRLDNEGWVPPALPSPTLDCLLTLAEQNRIFLLALSRLGKNRENAAYLGRFGEAARERRLEALTRHLEFDVLSKRFEDSGIPFIPLKGIILSRTVWPSLELREMSDIDILCKPQDAKKIKSCLDALGYRQSFSDPEIAEEILPRLDDEALASYIDSVEFRRASFYLEVHFKILSAKISRQLSSETLFTHSSKSIVKGKEVRTLSPQDELINISSHASYHNFLFGLRPLAEVDAIIRHYAGTIDWEIFLKNVLDCRLTSLVYPPMMLARSLYGSNIPEDILSRLRKGSTVIIRDLSDRLAHDFSRRDEIEILKDDSLFFHVISQGSSWGSLKRIFFPPLSYLKLKKTAVNKPIFLIYLEYPKRFVHLVASYFPSIIKRFISSLSSIYGRNRKV